MENSINQLAEKITRNSSRQTYCTIKFLVDPPLRSECYKAYAYFRWLDDEIDEKLKGQDRIDFINKQKTLTDRTYKRLPANTKNKEEEIIVSLINNDPKTNPKLESFIKHFFEVIEFDTKRQGVQIDQAKLEWYIQTLSIAVTDCIEYFVGNNQKYPRHKYEYNAAKGAHIAHILRDFKEDLANQYINAPVKYSKNNTDLKNWIKSEVDEAKEYFETGKRYIDFLPNFRIRLAARLYCDRFEWILDTIEKDNYELRKNYFPKRHYSNIIRFLITFFEVAIKHTL